MRRVLQAAGLCRPFAGRQPRARQGLPAGLTGMPDPLPQRPLAASR